MSLHLRFFPVASPGDLSSSCLPTCMAAASSLFCPPRTTMTMRRYSWDYYYNYDYCISNNKKKCLYHASFLSKPSNKVSFACQATMDTEPESNREMNKDDPATTESSILKSSLERIDNMLRASDSVQNKDDPATTESSNLKSSLERIDSMLRAPDGIQNKDRATATDSLDHNNSIERIDGVLNPPANIETEQEKGDEMEVASGSPLPGIKKVGEPIMIPKATIDILKQQVFGFDTFYVTSQEPYEQGVLFKGNLRGKAATSFEKITKRLQDRFEDQYKLFLLINPEDDEPVAVVVPKQTLQPETTAIPEWFAASAFGLVTIFTLLLRNVPALQSNLLSAFDNLELLKDGLPGALVCVLVLGIHEIGHILVANDIGIKLGVPYFVPSWQIGSFGAITRIVSIVSNREDLLKLAAAGPLAGFGSGLILLLLGFIVPPSDGIGDALREGAPLSVNPLVIWAWAGLLINAINSIPAGELDGGRISFALWGRKASSRVSSGVIAVLGICSLFSDVAFYWVVLIFFLQRGPIAPLSEEVTEPESKYVGLGVAILLLGLLVCLPYPFPFVANQF